MPTQLLIWLMILLTGIFDSISLLAQGMTIDWALRWPAIIFVSALVVMSVICLWFRRPEVSRLFLAAAQVSAMSQVLSIFVYAMAASPNPISDPMFMRADAALGFDWMWWFTWVSSHSTVHLILSYAYNSVPFQITIALVYFSYIDAKRIDEFLIAGMTALFITCMIAYLLPGIGAWSAHGVGIEPWREDLLALRAHSLLRIGNADGIITFPSYHTVLGVLLIYMYRFQKWLFYPIFLLNGLMIASVLSEGAHYLVDMLSGLAVAFVSLGITRYLLVWWNRSRVNLPFVKAAARPG
jgi:PAP2 superfamily